MSICANVPRITSNLRKRLMILPRRPFIAGFGNTRQTRVTTGTPTDGDAGAGSVYVTIPVRVDALLKNGRRQRFAGRYVMRRVNDVDGATAAQLRWHIASATLCVLQ